MLIILEGINGVGKSYLAKRLSEEYEIPIYKTFGKEREKLPEGKNREFFLSSFQKGLFDWAVADFLNQVPSDVIMDRSIISSYPYGDDENLELIKEWWKLCPDRTMIFFLYSMEVDKIQDRRKDDSFLAISKDADYLQQRYFDLFSKIVGMKSHLFKFCVDGTSKEEMYAMVSDEVRYALSENL